MLKIFQKNNIAFKFSTLVPVQEKLVKDKIGLRVSNVGYTTTKSDLLEFFKKFSHVKSIQLPVDEYGRQRGVAFLTFRNDRLRQLVKNITAPFNERILKFADVVSKEELKKRFETPEYQERLKSKIMIANIPYVATEQILREFFQSYGEIVHFKYNQFKGIAFIQFTNSKQAEKALEKHKQKLLEKEILVQIPQFVVKRSRSVGNYKKSKNYLEKKRNTSK